MLLFASKTKPKDDNVNKAKMEMTVSLPYKIGTKLKHIDEFSQTETHDRVDHYIVGKRCQAVLVLCYDTCPRISAPIDIEELIEKWDPIDN